jgi:hypothetical protein
LNKASMNMQFTVDLNPAAETLSRVLLVILEEVILTFHVGRAKFMDHMGLVYATCYVAFFVGLWISLILIVCYLIWWMVRAWVRFVSKRFLTFRARRYVTTLESLPQPERHHDARIISEPPKSRTGTLNTFGLNINGDPVGEPVTYAKPHPVNTNDAVARAAQVVKDKVKEMAMPTSTFFPSEHKRTTADGVMSVRSGSVIIGMASCIGYSKFGPCLVTAAHVWAELWKCGQPNLEHNGDVFPVNFEWKIVLDSSPHDLDIVIVAVPHSVFAAIGVKKLKTSVLRDSQKCITFGFNEDGYFGTSTGRVEHKPHEAFRCNHYATTTYGFSGSPLIVAGDVVGVHTGAELGLLSHSNLGTICFWMESKQLETPKKGEPGYRIELDFGDRKPERVVRFNTVGKEHSLEQVGRSIRLRFKPMDFTLPLDFQQVSLRWDDEDDYEVEWETISQRIGGKQRIKEGNEAPKEDSDFLKEERSPLTKPDPMANLPPGWTSDMFLQSLSSLLRQIQDSRFSSTSPTTKSAKLRKKKQAKALKTALALNSSEGAPTESLETTQETLPASTKPLKRGQISQSGRLPSGEQPPSEEVFSSRAVDSNVLVVRFTRKQEKLYNRVCQTRKYQQLLRSLGTEERNFLRQKLLEFVTTSKINLRETQVPVFLAQFSLETTPLS